MDDTAKESDLGVTGEKGVTDSPSPLPTPPPTPLTPTETKPRTGQSSGFPEQSVPADPEPVNPASVTIGEKKGSGFPVFIILGILIVLGVWGGVGYLYFQNQKLKTDKSAQAGEQTSAPSVTPTPSFSAEQVKIKNGSVVREIPGSDAQTLINKEDFNSTGITGFARVVVSPDNSKLCFESWPPAPEPALYIANTDGAGVVEVSPNRQKCMWTPDSKNILYINSSSESSASNIYFYSLDTGEEEELTASSVEKGTTRRFELVGLSADEAKVICRFEDVETEETGECEIELESKEVTYL